MKLKKCDSCGRDITEYEYVKCCSSKTMDDGKRQLLHWGDLCVECWQRTVQKEGGK